MKAPVKWLLSYTDVVADSKEAIHELASEMTLSGTKVESVDAQGAEIEKVVVGRCESVRPHENSDHLQICQIDVGGEGLLQIVTGAANIREGAFIPVALDGAKLVGGHTIKNGKLRGVDSFGMMCSFEEIGLDYRDFPGGIEDGLMIIQDLEDFKDKSEQELRTLIGKDIMTVLGADETVIDFEVTSNRADCFSILGLAREAAVTMKHLTKKGGTFTCPTPVVKEEDPASVTDFLKVRVDAPDLCPRYMARVVRNVKIAPSPKWMRDRLQAAGVRSINNIVDITNYVMLEYGQPMHAFDIRTIHNGEIIVRRAQDGEKLVTLDEVERTLDSSMLVIADPEGGNAVAGVMGGLNSEIREDTAAIVFESAIFDGVTVRRGAKKIGLRTESSSRFEKGLDVVTCAKALERAAELVEELGAGTVCKGVIDCLSGEKLPRKVECNVDAINKFIGIHANKEEMEAILIDLECEPHFTGTDGGYVIPPSFRDDLICDADIAEEIARFVGYNKIESSLLSGCSSTLGKRNRSQQLSDKVRNVLTGLGYNEMVSFSFQSPSVFDKLGLAADDVLRDAVVITNPLGEDFSIMRTSMLPTALDSLAVNHARRVPQAALFEISYVYHKTEKYPEELPVHKELVTLCQYGCGGFFEFKGDIEALLASLHITGFTTEPCSDMLPMHPGRTAIAMIGGKKAGFFGQIHPRLAKTWDVPEDTFVACLETSVLYEAAVDIPKNKDVPKFPAVTRNLAIVLDKTVPAGHVEQMIRERGGKMLESCVLFDCYEGAQVEAGKKSLAYSLAFRAPDRTLTDEDVSKSMKKILNGLEFKFSATLRE
ncbi:MAG: phenylalanine--tRNA ligase subunit beta [Clostridia bacterium]|nr:phenylalanine--tRNA ligase subunit beta [Clostridia bacterium]